MWAGKRSKRKPIQPKLRGKKMRGKKMRGMIKKLSVKQIRARQRESMARNKVKGSGRDLGGVFIACIL